TKSFGTKTLFHDVSLAVGPGDRVGLVGLNGTGKSTLLKVLTGLEPVDSGAVERQRQARVRYLAQEPALDPTSTPREIVREGLRDWLAAKRRYDRVSEALARATDPARLLTEQAAAAHDIEALGGWDREHIVEDMLGRLGVLAFDAPVGNMSGGERRRVAL